MIQIFCRYLIRIFLKEELRCGTCAFEEMYCALVYFYPIVTTYNSFASRDPDYDTYFTSATSQVK